MMRTVTWAMKGHDPFDAEVLPQACPRCRVHAIVALPPALLAKQSDGTTHVCLHAIGGCNYGFALEPVQ
jgi:hypothetical protein